MLKLFYYRKIGLVIFLLAAAVFGFTCMSKEEPVDFSADVKPILNKKCISCHGGVRAKGGFSVLFREEALSKTESGKPAIIPGDAAASEMIRRITSNDPEERMPYKHEALTAAEIKTLTKWVEQGAKWGDHWAYLPVKQVPVPTETTAWAKTDIDKFIEHRFSQEKMTGSREADKPTLLRRVSLDLIGTYPSEKIAQSFLRSTSPTAYETLVDSLLASSQYGEKWASMWLDLARYADTKGYESDGGRQIWQYRDWVIRAFNADKPYDEFLTEQIAGDLLPDPTDAQYIATAFSRNSMSNDEGGTDNEEFRTAAVMDRVSTTWEALMGTTFSCVQCHSHPYDPFKHDEYYKFLAYYNNTRDEDIPADYPLLREFNDTARQKMQEVLKWVGTHASETQVKKTELFLRTWQPSINSSTVDSMNQFAVIGNGNTSLLFRNKGVARIKHIDLTNVGQFIWNFYSNKKNGTLRLHVDRPDGPVVATIPITGRDNWRIESSTFTPTQGTHDIFLVYDNPTLPAKEKDDFTVVFDWMAFMPQFPGEGLAGYDQVKKSFWELVTAKVPTTPVMVENPADLWRPSHVFERGNRTTLGKQVEPGVPASLSYAMPANAPQNRLGLSMWLTNTQNPLVSRTIINRLWEQLFGAGITETLEDMGTQGIPPTHKELLDHLSYKIMHDYKWSLKKMVKEMVMSATYKQDSRVSDDLKERDPANKFYARGPRVRLSAEQIRDQDLYVSGVLSNKMYGPGVMPWQPDGIWLSPYNGARWEQSKGDEQYRRAIYTYWKRSSPYPSMITFDGAQRVVCSARRIRTNTPLQALVTLNDSVYIDLARHLATRLNKEAGSSIQQQIARGYQLLLFKPLPANKLEVFTQLYNSALAEFRSDRKAGQELLGKKEEEVAPESAAMVIVANAMLNMDEVVTKN